MAKYVHVSLYKRHHGKVFHPGGVEKFAHFLQMAIPELEILSTQDVDQPEEGIEPWVWAEHMNRQLLEDGRIDEDTVVVGDGFWVNGLQDKVARLISVCHGSYIGTAVEHEKMPFGEPHVGDWGLVQDRIWRECEVVSVSRRSQQELQTMCGIDSYIIEHGLPLDIYKPDNKAKSRLVLHVATSERKGKAMLATIGLYDRFEMDQLGFADTLEGDAKLWNRGGICFMPTHYEGNSYALIEAIACGLVPVTYYTGYACSLPCDVALVTDDYHEHRFMLMLEHVNEYYSNFFPREWACDNLNFDLFSDRWRSFLEV